MNTNKLFEKVLKTRAFSEKGWPFKCVVTNGHPKLAVVTGPNCSGKSILRKVLHSIHKDNKIEYLHFSQAARTTTGIERVFIYNGDENEDSTGAISAGVVLRAIKNGQNRDHKFSICFDEPEIGCGEELQSGIGHKIVETIETMPNLVTMIVVTHSREVARPLLQLNPTHARTSEDGLTLANWVNRKIKPASLEEVQELGRTNWSLVNKLMKAS